MKYAACVEYDGSRFSGWQVQKHNVRTVQGQLEQALSKVADQPIGVITAGRTDTGVHATHQVIHFESDVDRSQYAWLRGTNRFMPEDVRLRWLTPVDDEFHARFSALRRRYRYIIYNAPVASAIFRHQASHEYRQLDISLMQSAGQQLLGEHDFSSLRAAGCQAHSPIRTVFEFSLAAKGEWVWFDICANAFLQHMVRNIAGVLIEVGSGKRHPDWMLDLLVAKDRTKGAITAAPNGLYLTGVEYSDEFCLPSSCQLINLWND